MLVREMIAVYPIVGSVVTVTAVVMVTIDIGIYIYTMLMYV